MGFMTLVDAIVTWLLTLIMGTAAKSPLGLALKRAFKLCAYYGVALVLATFIDVISSAELVASYPFLGGLVLLLAFIEKLFKEMERPP